MEAIATLDSMPDGTETELRFRLDDTSWRALRRCGALGRARFARERVLSTYFDTPERGLLGRRATLRLRRTGRAWMQTLKAAAPDGSASRRIEWEMPVAGPMLDPRRFAGSALADWLAKPRVRDALEPVFTTDFQRQRARLRRAGSLIELSVDRGRIVAGEAHAAQPLHELELELSSGPPEGLYDYAQRLAERVALPVELRSKAERGYALLAAQPPAPRRARVPALEPELPVEQAFARIVWSCLAQAQANVDGTLAGSDVEYLHQLRVGLRRLRSAFSTFRPVVPRATCEALLERLRALAQATGPARDWDVFIGDTLPAVLRAIAAAEDRADAGRALAGYAQRARAAAAAEIAAALDPLRLTPLLIELMRYLDLAGWRGTADGAIREQQGAPVQRYARDVLGRRDRQVRRRVAAAPGGFEAMSAEERHALRIAVKKLRYAAEFFASLYPGARAARYAQALAGIQDVLGTLNDMAVAPRLLAAAAADRDPLLAGEARYALGYCAGVAAHSATRFAPAWAAFQRAPRFW